MIRTAEYNEIFEITKRNLKSKYTGNPVPSSDSFEIDVFVVLEESVAEWNSNRSAADQINITVHYLGSSRFPDGYLYNRTDNEKIGIEVKFHKSGSSWVTLGNSAFASTQEHDLVSIFVLFGHFRLPAPEFKVKPHNLCIKDISSTHNPRYNLDMNINQDFCTSQLGISYDELRELPQQQREIIVNSYMARKEYTELPSRDDSDLIRAQGFILFPEIFSPNGQRKYKRLGVWLFASNIFCRNVRDFISGSGKKAINIIGTTPRSKVFYMLHQSRLLIREEIGRIHPSLLKRSWYTNPETAPEISDSADDRLRIWIDLACSEAGGPAIPVEDSPYGFKETIERILLDP